jgi:LCP family protein required for cell wall assembly
LKTTLSPSPSVPGSSDGTSSVFVDAPDDRRGRDPFGPRAVPGGGDPWDGDDGEGEGGGGGRRRSNRQRVLLGVGVVVVMACLACMVGAFWVLRTYNSIDRIEDLELNQVAAGDPRNYLIVGSDSRGGENAGFGEVSGQRSDTIMVLRVDPETGEAFALSFPRDLQVEIAGTGRSGKINSAYADGEQGVQRLIDTLQQNFAIPIHHYVEIDFSGFKGLIEHIGGVPLYFDKAVRNPPGEHDVGLNITDLGCITVGADQALALARSRSLQYLVGDDWEDDPFGDYGRMTRQQIIIKQALKKAVQQAKSNPVQLSGMAELVAGTVTLDATLGISDLLDLADQFKDFDPNTLKTYALPIYTEDEEGRGDPHPDLVQAEPILNAFRGLPIDEVGPTLVELTVENGSGQEGQGANVAGAFQQIGFDVQTPTNAPEPVARTTVYHAPGQVAYGNRVARHLSAGADVRERADLGPGEVVLVTGSDFQNVWDQPIPTDELAATPAAPGATTPPATEAPADTTATTAAPTPTTPTEPAVPPPTDQVGYPAGQPPPGKTCG